MLLPALLLPACAFETYAPAPLEPGAAVADVAGGALVAPAHAALFERLAVPGAWPPARWTPMALGLIAIARSRQVDAALAEVDAANAARAVASARPNPRLSLGLERNSDLDPGDDSRWSIGPSFSYLWSPVDRGRIRAALATTEVVAARSAVLEAAWRARHAAAASACALAAAGAQATLRAREADALAAAVAIASRQVEAGVAQPYDWHGLLLEENSVALARIDDLAAVARAGGELASALAMPPAALDTDAVECAPGTEAPPLAVVQERALLAHPTVLRALAQYDKAEHDLALAVAAQYPEIELTPGYFFDQGDHVWSLVGGVVVPLFARHDTAIAAAEAARTAARERAYAVQGEVIAAVHAAWSAWQAAHTARTAAEGLAREIAARVARLAAAAGTGTVDNLSVARAAVQERQVARELAGFRARAAQASLALEYAARAALFDAPLARLLQELHAAGAELAP